MLNFNCNVPFHVSCKIITNKFFRSLIRDVKKHFYNQYIIAFNTFSLNDKLLKMMKNVFKTFIQIKTACANKTYYLYIFYLISCVDYFIYILVIAIYMNKFTIKNVPTKIYEFELIIAILVK